MESETIERIEQLKPKNAVRNLDALGRLFMDNREMSIWERDTSTLPKGARKWRKNALEFARKEIRPIAAKADLNPDDFDTKPLRNAAIRRGLLSLLLPFPLGKASITSSVKSLSLQVVLAAEELTTECGGLALVLLAPYLGIAPLLLSGHLPTYLRHFIPFCFKLTWFDNPACFSYAITEPGAGSDVEETIGGATARLVTTARPVKGGYVLNGRKCFISNGAIADKVTVYAKLEGEGIESWTCFIVEKSMKGFSVGRHERKMGQRASDASELIFEDVFVPNRNIVGKLRSGWANNRNVLNYSRPSVGAMSIGHGRGAFERALEFCRRTKLGNKRLIDYHDVQMELADMMISLSAARAMVWKSCMQFRCNQGSSAAVKVFASDTAVKVSNQAMELMGDHGYVHANGVERSWRDARLTQIYEGTNQINRLALIESQWDVELDRSVLGYG